MNPEEINQAWYDELCNAPPINFIAEAYANYRNLRDEYDKLVRTYLNFGLLMKDRLFYQERNEPMESENKPDQEKKEPVKTGKEPVKKLMDVLREHITEHLYQGPVVMGACSKEDPTQEESVDEMLRPQEESVDEMLRRISAKDPIIVEAMKHLPDHPCSISDIIVAFLSNLGRMDIQKNKENLQYAYKRLGIVVYEQRTKKQVRDSEYQRHITFLMTEIARLSERLDAARENERLISAVRVMTSRYKEVLDENHLVPNDLKQDVMADLRDVLVHNEIDTLRRQLNDHD